MEPMTLDEVLSALGLVTQDKAKALGKCDKCSIIACPNHPSNDEKEKDGESKPVCD